MIFTIVWICSALLIVEGYRLPLPLPRIFAVSKIKSSNQEDLLPPNTYAISRNLEPRMGISSNPMRAMVFIDGTWLYYSLVEGRHDRVDPVLNLLGKDWNKKYRIDWQKLPYLIATNLGDQLKKQYSLRQNVEIVRTSVFTSMRSDSVIGGGRERMVNDFYEANFDVHRYETKNTEEKCVDVALAVEMLYLSVVDAFDIAIIVAADKDFIPALEKVRLTAKKVAICSMRNSVNPDLSRPDARIRDFDMIWLDDYIKELFVPKRIEDLIGVKGVDGLDTQLLTSIAKRLAESPEPLSSRDMGRYLQTVRLGNGQSLHAVTKSSHGSIRLFLEKYPQYFTLSDTVSHRTSNKEYSISLTTEFKASEEKSKSALWHKKDSQRNEPLKTIDSEEGEENELKASDIANKTDESHIPSFVTDEILNSAIEETATDLETDMDERKDLLDADDENKTSTTPVVPEESDFQKLFSEHSNLSVKEIKAKLKQLGIKAIGTKDVLLENLCNALVAVETFKI